MSTKPLRARFSQRCRCGKNTAPGDDIQYNFKTRQVDACPACFVPVKPVTQLIEYTHAGYRYSIQASATAWVAVPFPGQHKAAARHAKRAAAAWLAAGGPGATSAPRQYKLAKVFVIMGNDYPNAVFDDQEAAEKYIYKKNCEHPDYDKLNRKYPLICRQTRIHWRWYQFEVRS